MRLLHILVSLAALCGAAWAQEGQISLTSTPNPSNFGSFVTLTVNTVDISSPATVTFLDGTKSIGTAPLTAINSDLGSAFLLISTLAVGTHSLTATIGNGTSNTVTQTVNKATTSLSISSSPNPSTFGQTVTITATIATSLSGETGTITFFAAGAQLGAPIAVNSSGIAIIQTSSLPVGGPVLTATYSGDANFAGSTAAGRAQTVNPATSTTTLSSSPNPSALGQNVTLTAAVTAGATGTVTFFDGQTPFGSPVTVANGIATIQTSTLAAGIHSLTASYSGDANFSRSTSNTVTQTVKAVTHTSLSVSPNPANTGQVVTLTATVTPATATGTVIFLDGTNIIATVNLNSGGTATTTTSTLTAGTHSLTATYNGDSNNATSFSPAVSLAVNQTAGATSTVLTATPNPATVGSAVTLTATVTPASATGSVSFRDGTNPIGSGTLSGGTASFTTASLAAGSHTLTAVYSGDASDATSTSPPVTEVVNKAATTTSLTASPNNPAPGQAVTLTATVAPSSATGTVTFTDGSNSLGSAPVNGGTAVLTVPSFTTGSHPLTALYGGDINFNTSSGTLTLAVGKSATTTSLTASPNPAAAGQTVTLTALVSGSGATGNVTFAEGTNPIGSATLNNGTASVTTASLAAGSHTLTATYSGDGNFNGSSGTVTLVVGKANTTTSLTASPTSITPGQTVTLTATVSPAGATGTVTFADGTNPIGSATLSNGTASITTATLTSGSHTVTATYGGDSNFNGSSGTAGVAVGPGTSATSLSVSPNPATAGQSVTLNALVVPTSATGTVTFKDSGATLGTVSLASGSATFSSSTLTVGNHSLTATYSGDNTFSSSTSNTIVEVVTQGTTKTTTTTTLTASPNPQSAGQPVSLNALVVPASATGTVTFLDGTTTIGTATLTNGVAAFSTSALSGGNHSLTASYGGDNADSTSTSNTVTELINTGNVTVTLAASPNPANFGQAVTLTIAVSPASSTGTITVFDSVTAGTVGGTATLNGGSATITISTLKVGSHSLQAFYSGPNNLAGESNFVTEVINAAPTTTTLTVSSSLLTATVSPSAATGTVTFKDGTTTLGTATLSNGTATFTATTLAQGSHTLTAVYSGDGNFAPSTSNTVTVTPGLTTTSTTLTASPASSTPGQTVTLTATVAPATATGTVTFLDGSTSLGTATLSAGTATLTTSTLASGTHTITASYGGDSKNGSSTSNAVTETVGLPIPRVVLTASPNPSTSGQTVTLTAVVTPATATGAITFLDGSTTLGTATLSGGTATLTTNKLNSGTNTLTASYGGDANNAPATSAAVTETVNSGTPLQVSLNSIPPAFAGVAYTQTFTASGGTPPLTWIAGPNTSGTFVPGPVDGLSISGAGVLSGTPTAAGSFSLAVRVTDSTGSANAVVLTLTVNPALPPISITVAQPTTISDQPAPTAALGTGFPVPLNGTYRLTFTPNASGLPAGFTNSAVQFVTGGTTSPTIAIPANSTAPVTLPAVQLGTVAGTITVQLASLTVASTGQSVPLPTPAPSVAISVPRLAPIIVPGSVKITSVTSSGFQVILDASSTPRDLSSANFTFTAASGSTLNGTSFTVSLTSVAAPWFDPTNATGVSNGGAFSLTFPFTFSGSTSALGTVSVTLTNSVGTSAAVSGGQ